MNIGCLLILLLLARGTQSQEKKIGTLYISGKVVNEKKRGLESTVYIYRDKKQVKEVPTSKIGKFNVDLDMQDSVALVFFCDGYVSKTVVISTKIHPAKQHKSYDFPFFVDLYPVGRVPAPIDLERPVGRVNYQGGQFVYDNKFTEEKNDDLKEFVKERRQLKVRETED